MNRRCLGTALTLMLAGQAVLLAGCVSVSPLPDDASPALTSEATASPAPATPAPASPAPASPAPASSTPMPVRSPGPSPTIQAMFQEDFSTDSLWPPIEGRFGEARVIDGSYRMRVGREGGYLYGSPTNVAIFDDATVEVSVTLVEGADDAADEATAAVACRGVDDFVWYELGITSTGVAFISHVRLDGTEDLAVVAAAPLMEGDTVRLAATCEGVRDIGLSLSMDGETLVEATDVNGFALGFVALVVSGRSSATFEFDEVLIRRP